MDKLYFFIGLVGMIVILGLLMALPTWLLWNAFLVPAIEGVKEIGFIQAWGLNVLFTGLFKNTTSTSK